jgi:hypothetical protein
MPDEPLGRLGPVDGQSGEVAVTITGMSFREKNGERRSAYAGFPPDLLYALHDQLAAPRLKGILGRKVLCPSCAASPRPAGSRRRVDAHHRVCVLSPGAR